MDTLDFARAYAGLKMQSFPCKPRDKTPLVRWADVATVEDNMLVGWWDTNPSANIGIACGQRSGIVVLDVDTDHNGYESLQALQDKYGRLPETPTSKTGTGGEHLFFKHPGIEIRNSAGKLGPGLDIRGDGGYVVAPPSIHPNGNRYEWLIEPSEVTFADMPKWLIELSRESNHAESSKIISHTDGMIPPGERHQVFLAMAGAMRRKGMNPNSIYVALMEENRLRCDPLHDEKDIMDISKSIEKYPPQDVPKISLPLPSAWSAIESLENEIIERGKNPKQVWGIHYAYPFLSVITGGKQKGELTILAGEPKVGKSFWAHQDFLFSALGNPALSIPCTPSLIWCGEMKRKQIYRRFFEMLGVPKRHMQTGQMSETDWQFFNEAKALIVNSPIYVSDVSLELQDVKPLLEREIGEHGIEQVLFDYDWLIHENGSDEIQQSQNISRTMKNLSHDFDISITLISSVNKMGMDKTKDSAVKTNVSGSGKKLHDADVIYIMTKFNGEKNGDLSIMPSEYDKIATLHIAAGRDLDFHLPGGAINYMRETPSPKFREMRPTQELPNWIK